MLLRQLELHSTAQRFGDELDIVLAYSSARMAAVVSSAKHRPGGA